MKTKLAMWKCEKCGRVWKQQSSMEQFNSGMRFCTGRCGGISLLVREGYWKKVARQLNKSCSDPEPVWMTLK